MDKRHEETFHQRDYVVRICENMFNIHRQAYPNIYMERQDP